MRMDSSLFANDGSFSLNADTSPLCMQFRKEPQRKRGPERCLPTWLAHPIERSEGTKGDFLAAGSQPASAPYRESDLLQQLNLLPWSLLGGLAINTMVYEPPQGYEAGMGVGALDHSWQHLHGLPYT